jgi:hypothetical protein
VTFWWSPEYRIRAAADLNPSGGFFVLLSTNTENEEAAN